MGYIEKERAENKNPRGGGDTCNARVGPTSVQSNRISSNNKLLTVEIAFI